MTTDIKLIEEIYRRQIFLFNKLLECVSLERDSLINLEVNTLWSVMSEKQKIMEEIEEVREKLIELVGEGNPYSKLPVENRSSIKILLQKLSEIKEEIKIRVKENISFINESMDFFHEIFSIFTAGASGEDPYGKLRKNPQANASLMYHNEA